MKNKQTFKYLLIPLIFCACAETPAPVVKAKVRDKTGVEDVKLGLPTKLSSLAFRGYESVSGRQCKVYISFLDLVSGPVFIVRPELIIHGATPLDLVFNFYQYSFDENLFFPPDPSNTTTQFSSAAVRLGVRDSIVDINNIEKYESDLSLIQFIRIDYKRNTYLEFKDKLIESLRTLDHLSLNYESLDIMDTMIIKIKHFDHYDSAACIELKLDKNLQLIEFK